MLDIDTILDMLDWNNDIETQEKGIEEGKKVRSLEAFIQPYHEKNSKAVWENCAKILSCKNDEELWPHIRALLHWLGDSNWPGYEIILDRLLKFQDLDWLGSVVKECVREAYILNDQKWLVDMQPITEHPGLEEHMPPIEFNLLKSACWEEEE